LITLDHRGNLEGIKRQGLAGWLSDADTLKRQHRYNLGFGFGYGFESRFGGKDFYQS
jgi:hypothetical protein